MLAYHVRCLSFSIGKGKHVLLFGFRQCYVHTHQNAKRDKLIEGPAGTAVKYLRPHDMTVDVKRRIILSSGFCWVHECDRGTDGRTDQAALTSVAVAGGCCWKQCARTCCDSLTVLFCYISVFSISFHYFFYIFFLIFKVFLNFTL